VTFDGIWTYAWDGENRLTVMAMTNVGGIPNSQRKRLEFTYDHLSRRLTKTVGAWNGSTFTNAGTTKFLYDGCNLVAEVDASGNVLRSYVWGLDFNGSLNEAGGIGGLLLVADHVPSTDTYHFLAYDGNGNITALINASDQSTSARYEYSPFGELLRSTGSLAKSNPFRFGSKFTDEESSLIYYGYRYYSSSLGRWLNRDPIEEEGGINVYAFCRNNTPNRYDRDGRFAPLLVVLYVIVEISLSSYDLYDAIDTITDPEASLGDKLLSAGGFVIGGVAPGGGYGVAGKRIKTLTGAAERVRHRYVAAVRSLADRATELRGKGYDSEYIARVLHSKRRELGIIYKDVTPPGLRQQIFERNLKKYGDPWGPTIDRLRAQGKSWDDIIESATRPGGGDLGF
jgi:RHS repeat-associated protein